MSMKLRYYLRGLGIGILVTVLVMSIAGGKGGELSDAQIRERAAELGMIDSSSQVLSNLQTNGSGNDPEPADAEKETTEPAGEGNADADPVDTEPAETDQTEPPGTENPEDDTVGAENAEPQTVGMETNGAEFAGTSPAETMGDESAAAQANSGSGTDGLTESAEGRGETVSITITRGEGSESVSRDLEAAGLIENAGNYNDYLTDNGYSRRLRAGTFSIPVGASEEEIAKIITGSR